MVQETADANTSPVVQDTADANTSPIRTEAVKDIQEQGTDPLSPNKKLMKINTVASELETGPKSPSFSPNQLKEDQI